MIKPMNELEEVQKQILYLLNEDIETELDAMTGFYSLAEIAEEAILSYVQREYKLIKRV